VGLFFSAIAAIFDLRAAVSSGKKMVALDKIASDAKAAGHDPEVVKAVQYAMEQKFGKAVRRAITFVAAAISSGVSIAGIAGAGTVALASNPIGWGILTVLAAGAIALGAAITIYKIGRWIYKKFSGVLGEQRRDTALTLYKRGVVGGDTVAAAALKELGLDHKAMKAALSAEEPVKDAKHRKEVIADVEKNIGRQQDKLKAVEAEKANEEKELRRSHTDKMKKKHQEKIAYLDERIQHYKEKTANLGKELDWKNLTKAQRNDVKSIEDKLKK